LFLNLKRQSKNIISPQANKLIFFLTNRYISHTVMVIIIFITIIQNVGIKQLRAEDFGRTALFAKIYQGQSLSDSDEEEILLLDLLSLNGPGSVSGTMDLFDDLSPALGQKIVLSEAAQDTPGTALASGGSAMMKPEITETIDTPKPRENTIIYIVATQDTIFDIAEQFNVSVNTILWANKLSSRSIIRPGDKLKILPVTGIEHVVSKGDTIGSIADKYKISQKDILEINQMGGSDTILAGQVLIIPDGQPLYTPPVVPRRSYVATTPPAQNITTSGDLFWPTICRRITQYFKGWRHTGIDVACASGSNIYAAEEGTVTKAGWNAGGYGNRIIIRHPDGSQTLYGHLKTGGILVEVGEYVKKGQVIGKEGSTGRSTGPHLHFEVIENGSRINPFDRL